MSEQPQRKGMDMHAEMIEMVKSLAKLEFAIKDIKSICDEVLSDATRSDAVDGIDGIDGIEEIST